jgi:hypothetical protein
MITPKDITVKVIEVFVFSFEGINFVSVNDGFVLDTAINMW